MFSINIKNRIFKTPFITAFKTINNYKYNLSKIYNNSILIMQNIIRKLKST